jgi:arylsulfatase A-like enzyme
MDSLNRHFLNVYGNSFIKTPNIDRLAKRGIVFENHYSGSLPCMPARREMMTGRFNFMETPWGPIEPWDDCLPVELKKQKGIYCHMITDHYHYFHSGGEVYNTLFDTWEFERGQEGDFWHPLVKEPKRPVFKGKNRRPYWVNREFAELENEEDYSTPRCFKRAIEFIENNHQEDNWHLHLELFDPHEPFMCPQKYIDMYNDSWDNRYHFDWPKYAPVEEEEEAVEHIINRYAGVLTMADHWLGKLLDKMDEYNMWKDTVIIFSTDHGHLLGEHGYWAKNYTFDYQELVHIPLIMCTPETAFKNKKITALTQTVDIMPTIMELHKAQVFETVHGKSLLHLLNKDDEKHHDTVLYGYFGKDINIFDGQYSYCRQPVEDSVVYHHTAMPREYHDFCDRDLLKTADFGQFLKHTYGISHFRLKKKSYRHHNAPDYNIIYDIKDDPNQRKPIMDEQLEKKLSQKMIDIMKSYDAPENEFKRIGLDFM